MQGRSQRRDHAPGPHRTPWVKAMDAWGWEVRVSLEMRWELEASLNWAFKT